MPALDTIAKVHAEIRGGLIGADADVAASAARNIAQARPVIQYGYEPRHDVLVIQRDTGYIVIVPRMAPMECDDWDDAHEQARMAATSIRNATWGDAGRVFGLAEGDTGMRDLLGDEHGNLDEPTRIV